MKTLLIILIISTTAWTKDSPEVLYKKYFKYSDIKTHKVADTISENPINNEIKEFRENKKTLGYVREVTTTTGCNSACLPIIATFIYGANKALIALESRVGLTKKNHVMMTDEDLAQLNLVLAMNPDIFKQVKHPKDMVDAITSETKKEYAPYVVKEAAYSSLRLNLYNQDTLKLLKAIN